LEQVAKRRLFKIDFSKKTCKAKSDENNERMRGSDFER
jgi:hypothetical protein